MLTLFIRQPYVSDLLAILVKKERIIVQKDIFK